MIRYQDSERKLAKGAILSLTDTWQENKLPLVRTAPLGKESERNRKKNDLSTAGFLNLVTESLGRPFQSPERYPGTDIRYAARQLHYPSRHQLYQVAKAVLYTNRPARKPHLKPALYPRHFTYLFSHQIFLTRHRPTRTKDHLPSSRSIRYPQIRK